ncbi:uroporphyrinogen-III C-methyltransferase [Acidocella sp.]|uniref:uroporphyrinogen-III C-methyltransferase n=1 Tax=Acidocella sp. TaxID=50710 RepID=UPI002604A625|nr:uroporphyrinogen-III C-methyltransferase [Acidocella sp.]
MESSGANVYLAGAGPGGADLLTLKTLRLLERADIILHDSLVGADVLRLANPAASLIDVGKRCGGKAHPQAEICRLLVEAAQTGAMVLRLKGGDPMIFGRATEEMAALRAAGIAFEVVPGVTAAAAAAAALATSLTMRDVSRAVHLLAAHGSDGGLPPHDWAALARAGGTFAVYMGVRTLPVLAANLLAAGIAADMPAAAVENIALPNQRLWRATLAALPGLLAAAAPAGPVLLLIGEALRE